jgi:hypothetical protein
MLPNNLKYQPKVESAPARRYRTNIQPQNGTGPYTQGNTVIFNIPTRNNSALIASESVLKFTMSATLGATAANTFSLESCGAHALFNRLRVFHGSNLLQDIQEYHQLAKIMYDYQMPLDATQGRFSITSGTTNEYTGPIVSATAANQVANGVIVKPVNRGKTYVPQADSATPNLAGGSTISDTFSINLISLVGSLAGGKYLPLWEMTSAPLRVELVLNSSILNAFCIAPSAAVPANGAYSLTNVEFIGEFLELPDSAIAAVRAGSSNPLQMVYPDWRAYTYSAALSAGSSTSISMPIPAKFSSLKSILVNSREVSPSGAATFYPISSNKLSLNSYQFRIGSEVLPSTAPNNDADFFNEALKCFGSIADLDIQPSIDVDAFTQNRPIVVDSFIENVTSNSGAFLVGIDCENYQNADKGAIFSGMNTNTSDIFYQPTHNAIAAITAYYTAFACYDCVLVCENGVAYVRY